MEFVINLGISDEAVYISIVFSLLNQRQGVFGGLGHRVAIGLKACPITTIFIPFVKNGLCGIHLDG